MTDFTANSFGALRTPRAWLTTIKNLFTSMADGYRSYHLYKELNDLTDDQLRRMGLSRQDLPRLAAEPILNKNS